MRNLKVVLLVSGCFMFGNVAAQNSQDVATVVEKGRLVFEQTCLPCHQADGSGVPGLAPPLIKGTFVGGDKKRLIRIVLNGLEGVEIKGEQYANPMPSFDFLTDAQIADVLTYVRSHFKNNAGPVSEAEVTAARK